MIRVCVAFLILGIGFTQLAKAETPEEKGLRIAKTASQRGQGYGSVESVGEMKLRDKRGVRSVRRFRTKSLEMGDGTDRYIIVFEQPRDIAGTAVLTQTRRGRSSNQWIYLPELKRVKRISSGGRTSAFAGSEFSYEDLASPPVDRFTYKWLRDEACPGQAKLKCHVIARFPRDKSSGYSSQTVWMDVNEYRLYRTDFYNRAGTHLKTLTARNYRRYEGRFWLADALTMTNLRTGKSTVMTWSSRDFSVRYSSKDFTQRALRRIR